MIIRRILLVRSITNESHQKVSVDAFIVMQWHEVQIVKAKAGSDQKNNDDTNAPDVLRETLLARRWFLLAIRESRLLSARFFTAT